MPPPPSDAFPSLPPPPPPLPPVSTDLPPPPPPPSRTPLSVEEMLKRKRDEEEAKSKPKFLTKEERARIAIEKRNKEIEARKAQEAAKLTSVRDMIASHGDSESNHKAIPTGPRAMRESNGDLKRPNVSVRLNRQTNRSDTNRDSVARDEEYKYSASELSPSPESIRDSKTGGDESAANGNGGDSIKARYMGIAQPKNKKRRLNDRKFVFDWSEDADTSKSDFLAPQPVNIGFGRGHFGGLGQNTLRNRIDRHWTEKVLNEMTERDWRIFREDYNISIKGKHVPKN